MHTLNIPNKGLRRPKSIAHPALLILLLSGCSFVTQAEPANAQRLDEVTDRGAHVMPFGLDKTMHYFAKTPIGGVQQVVTKSASDDEQIALIRKHLANLAERFTAGDFTGPQSIHGKDMPGTQAMAANAQRVKFEYQDLPTGGEIKFVSAEPDMIAAIHQFMDAQLSDHARHAQTGMHAMHHVAKHQPAKPN